MDEGKDPRRGDFRPDESRLVPQGLTAPDEGGMASILAALLLAGGRHPAGRRARALAAAGLAAEPPAGAVSPLSPCQYRQLLHALGPRAGDEYCGLAGRRLPPGSLRTLCRLLVQSTRLGDAIRAGTGFHHLLVDDLRLRLSRRGGEAAIRIADRIADADRRAAAHIFTALVAYGLLGWLAGRRICLSSADFATPGMPAGGRFTFAAGAGLRFGQTCTVLRFDSAWLDQPVIPSEAAIPALLDGLPELLVAGYRDRRSMTERVLALLRRDVAGGIPLEHAAAILAVSPATLRRRLREEGRGGFMQLKEAVRQEAAIRALSRSTAPLDELARHLGYAELSTFHRAFKRWTGLSPGAFRASQRIAAE